jgi:integrase
MRPLRRCGELPDVLWDEGIILVRRSETLGEIMNTTKTKVRQRIGVPAEVTDTLRWHVDTQLVTPEQKGSELLFPSEEGGFRSESCLAKAFSEVGVMAGFKKRFTPSGMRRTFNDLARLSGASTFVISRISGHQTDRMREHYSTAHGAEQRNCIEGIDRPREVRRPEW